MTKVQSLIYKFNTAKDTKIKLGLLIEINQEIDKLIKETSKKL